MATWKEFESAAPKIAEAGKKLLYQGGPGLPAMLFFASMIESLFSRYERTVELQRRALTAWPSVPLAWRMLFPTVLILTFLFLCFRFARV